MAKITFMGAGSTVFAKNILGDCMLTPALQRRAHRAVRHRRRRACAESQADAGHAQPQHQRRAAPRSPRTSGVANRQAALRGRRLRRQRHPGRRLRAPHGDRLRDPQEVRPAPDHRRHAGHRRHLPRACAPSPSCWTSPATWRRSAPTPGSSTTPTRWPCSPAPCCAARAIQTVGPVPQRAGLRRRAPAQLLGMQPTGRRRCSGRSPASTTGLAAGDHATAARTSTPRSSAAPPSSTPTARKAGADKH